LAVFLISVENMDANGVKCRLIMMRDITELKIAESNAEEREKLFESLVYNLPHVIIIHNNGKILFANEAFKNNFGSIDETPVGQTMDTFIRMRITDDIPKQGGNPQIAQRKARLLNEFNYTTPDGTLKYFNFKTLPVRYQGQQAHISILVDTTERKILEQAVLDKLLESEEEERSQYAADLHDDLGPILSAIKLYLSSIMDLITGNGEVMVRLSKSINFIDEAIIKLKIITNNISSDSIGRFGLDSSLRTFIDKINWHGRLKINLKSNINDLRFSPKIETNIYRIISELINNSLQHSGAQLIDLKLNYSRNTLSLVYQDDGKGFDVKRISLRNTGSGLINMINRVNLLEGSIDFQENDGKVTTLISIDAHSYPVN